MKKLLKFMCVFAIMAALLAVACGCSTQKGNCDHCGKKVTWHKWDKADSLPTKSGHWFLGGNVQLDHEQLIPEGQKVILDLSGHTVSNSDADRIYHVSASGSGLVLLDRSDSKSGKLLVDGELSHEGGAVLVSAGNFEMYDITLDASGSVNTRNGGAVCVAEEATFHMHSGAIIGAKLQTVLDDNGFPVGGAGGSVAVSGTMTMDNGVIRDGIALSHKDIVTENETAMIAAVYNGFGGNIYAFGESTVSINNGQILNGTAEVSGGNIYLEGFTVLRLHEGTVSGGKTTLAKAGGESTDMRTGGGGGNLFISDNSDFWMDSGVISDGVTRGYGGNIRCEGILNLTAGKISGGRCFNSAEIEYNASHKNVFLYNGAMDMSGGEIAGYIQVSDYYDSVCSVRLAGTAKIVGADAEGVNLELPYGMRISIAELRTGADIHMSVHNGAFTEKTSLGNIQYITLDNTDEKIQYYDNTLYINGRVNCICGLDAQGKHFGDCDGTMQVWGEWTDTEKLPTNSGYFYLANDIDLTGTALVRGQKEIFVDFNGKRANNGTRNWRLYSLFDTEKSITLTLTDTSEKKNGGLKVHGRLADQGMAVWCRSRGHSLVMYGGILDASNVTNRKDGSAVCGHNGTSITIHGGTIIGGNNIRYDYKEASGSITILGGSGGAVCAEGTFRMTGGTIRGGKATGKMRKSGMDCGNGGNLYIGPKCEAVITGGSIYGGTAYKGGNIAVWGRLTISGGKIYGGTASSDGANIYVFSGLNVSIDKKCVDGGIAYYAAP